MNFFLDQGRCRVCGRIFCCATHQKLHEKLEHDEYAKWLDILPICCRTCGKRMSTLYDLRSKCVLFNRRHSFADNSFGTPRPSRKRRLDENLVTCTTVENPSLRRRLVPSHKQAKYVNSPNLLDLSGRKVISPQLNVSYKILKTDAKSSTPLNEDDMDKENLVVAISVQRETTTYCTPDNALILVSAMKSSQSRKSDGRRVTFDTASPELSVYSTPPVTFGAEETVFTHEMMIVSPAIDENVSNAPETEVGEAGERKLAKIARNVRLTLNGIPRSLTSIWEWTQRRMRRKKQRDKFDSPVSLRKRPSLKRRPISSYWVSMSITSMVRDPLPNYTERYSAVQRSE